MLSPEQARLACDVFRSKPRHRPSASAWLPLPGCSAGRPAVPHAPSGLPVPPHTPPRRPLWPGRSCPEAARAGVRPPSSVVGRRRPPGRFLPWC